MIEMYFCIERAVNQTPLCQLEQHRLFFYTAVGLIDTVGCGASFLNNYPALFQKQALAREAAIHGEYRQSVLPGAFLRCSKQSITHSQSSHASPTLGLKPVGYVRVRVFKTPSPT